MSDEGPSSSAADDELSLPKATVQKLINDMLPAGIVCSKETRDTIIECCVEFIHLISAEANGICEEEAKKTISPEHIIGALKKLGFESYVAEVEETMRDHKQQQRDRERKSSKLGSEFSEEELLRQQEELFAQSRAKFEAGGGAPTLAVSEAPEDAAMKTE
jgi:histone H3/H4